jgi:carboxylesterase
MNIEWAWLRNTTRVAEAEDAIALEGAARCRVLLFHGLTGTPTEFAFVARFMHRRGQISVERPRLANHGQPIAVLARTRWGEILSAARRDLSAASERAKRDRAILVVGGLSLGAILSLILAAERPKDVAGVMALSPTLFYDGWNVPWSRRLIGLADYLPLKHFIYLRESPPYGFKDAGLREQIAATYERARLKDDGDTTELGYAHFPLRLFCEIRHLIALCRRTLPSVRAPLLLLQAEEDDATSPRNAHYILEKVGSHSTKLVMLANSYHVITADLDRAEVAAAMTQFCLSLLARPTDVEASHA